MASISSLLRIHTYTLVQSRRAAQRLNKYANGRANSATVACLCVCACPAAGMSAVCGAYVNRWQVALSLQAHGKCRSAPTSHNLIRCYEKRCRGGNAISQTMYSRPVCADGAELGIGGRGVLTLLGSQHGEMRFQQAPCCCCCRGCSVLVKNLPRKCPAHSRHDRPLSTVGDDTSRENPSTLRTSRCL